MKYLLLPLVIVLLTGCVTPAKRQFPAVPQELTTICPDLALVDKDEKKLSAIVSVVTENYALYHECRIKVDLWIDWYYKQKRIYESVK